MNFYWYNEGYLKAYIQNKRQADEITMYELGDPRYKKLYDINRVFSHNPWGMLHDISGHVPHPFNVVTKTPYQYESCDKNFGQVCLDVAKKIADSTTRKISVNWSGGIDSTSALVALLQTVPKDRLVVVCDQASINEYPEFYNDVIHNQIETLGILEWCDRATEFYSVSGDAGDSVWGVIDDSFWETRGSKFNKPWKDWLAKKEWVDKEFIEEFCSWSGVQIHTVLDLRVWFYLCCKWQDKSMKFYVDRPGLNREIASPFFDFDNSFQVWTINNLNEMIGDTWHSYKMPAKEFIYDFYPDKNYRDTKTKGYSSNLTERSALLWKIKTGTNKFAVDVDYGNHVVPCWPFVDQVHFEDWNDQYQLISPGILEV